jgi:hypothetical protein
MKDLERVSFYLVKACANLKASRPSPPTAELVREQIAWVMLRAMLRFNDFVAENY